jgi:hypothetical protein
MTEISTVDVLKIQARAVGPIVRALEKKIGKEEARELVRDAIASAWADYVETSFTKDETPKNAKMPFNNDWIIATDTFNEYSYKMVKCDAAEYFRSIGEEDIGALLSCGVDHEVEKRRLPDWIFSRTQTLMLGADHCDFCYRRR